MIFCIITTCVGTGIFEEIDDESEDQMSVSIILEDDPWMERIRGRSVDNSPTTTIETGSLRSGSSPVTTVSSSGPVNRILRRNTPNQVLDQGTMYDLWDTCRAVICHERRELTTRPRRLSFENRGQLVTLSGMSQDEVISAERNFKTYSEIMIQISEEQIRMSNVPPANKIFYYTVLGDIYRYTAEVFPAEETHYIMLSKRKYERGLQLGDEFGLNGILDIDRINALSNYTIVLAAIPSEVPKAYRIVSNLLSQAKDAIRNGQTATEDVTTALNHLLERLRRWTAKFPQAVSRSDRETVRIPQAVRQADRPASRTPQAVRQLRNQAMVESRTTNAADEWEFIDMANY